MEGKLYNLGDDSTIVVKSGNSGIKNSDGSVQGRGNTKAEQGAMVGNTIENNQGGTYGLSGQTGDYSLEESAIQTRKSERNTEPEETSTETAEDILNGRDHFGRAIESLKALEDLN